jgi:hypothetical protein
VEEKIYFRQKEKYEQTAEDGSTWRIWGIQSGLVWLEV